MATTIKNKKALFDYQVLDTVEAGIVLTGDEVKSVRQGDLNLTGSFATVHQGELFLINCHISSYKQAYQKKGEEEERRSRKLLLHKRELMKLIGDVSRKGITLVPLKLYINARGLIKIELGLCKHKKKADKKKILKEKDIKKETARELKSVHRYK